ncbi:glutathione peroxidase [Methylomonas rapida]
MKLMETIYSYSANSLAGETIPLESFKGQVLLIVNTASRCGFTPQYRGLEQLYREFKDQGFAVLGFPCNQFGKQEPGNSQEIADFCEMTYQVSFPLFEKIAVNGKHAHPLYTFLKSQASGALGSQAIKWNFTKFLIDRQGRVVKRYSPFRAPAAIRSDIEHLLQNQPTKP